MADQIQENSKCWTLSSDGQRALSAAVQQWMEEEGRGTAHHGHSAQNNHHRSDVANGASSSTHNSCERNVSAAPDVLRARPENALDRYLNSLRLVQLSDLNAEILHRK